MCMGVLPMCVQICPVLLGGRNGIRSHRTRLTEGCKLLSEYQESRPSPLISTFVLNQCFYCVIEFIHGYAYQKTNTQAYLECTKQPQQVSMTQSILPNLSIKQHLLSILKITFTHGYMQVHVRVCSCVPQYTCMKVRGQLVRIGSPTMWVLRKYAAYQDGGKQLTLLRYLVSPSYSFLHIHFTSICLGLGWLCMCMKTGGQFPELVLSFYHVVSGN